MERLEPELKQIVKRSTTQIADHAYQRGENLAQESQPRYSNKQDKDGTLKEEGTILKYYGFVRVENNFPKSEDCYRSVKKMDKLEVNDK